MAFSMAFRWLILIWSLAGWPQTAAAQAVHHIRFSQPPIIHVIHKMERQAGSVSFSVATNTGYEVLISRPDGAPIDPAQLRRAGFVIGIVTAGPNARASGESVRDAREGRLAVWVALERTASRRGDASSQYVTFVAAWRPEEMDFEPEFSILARP
jgi:hypothetical protein